MASRVSRTTDHVVARPDADGTVRRRAVRDARVRLDPVPYRPWLRWLLRLGLALPYAVLAVATALGTRIETPNTALIQHVGAIDWARADAAWLGDIMPPITSFIALAIPDPLVLGILGALIAGYLVQRVIEIMVQRRIARPVAILLVLALATSPLTAYTAVGNLAGILGLTCFGIGISHATRFVIWSNTRSGFIAGIAFMIGALSDSAGIAAVVAAAIVVPLARVGRAGQRGARWANLLVIVFPTVAAYTSMMILAAVFSPSPFTIFANIDVASAGERLAVIGATIPEPRGWAMIAILAVAWFVALVLRSIGVLVGATLVFIAQLGAYVLGLVPETAGGNVFILLTLVAVAFLPRARSLATIGGLTAAMVLQLIVGWFAAFATPVVVEWMDAVLVALGLPE